MTSNESDSAGIGGLRRGGLMSVWQCVTGLAAAVALAHATQADTTLRVVAVEGGELLLDLAAGETLDRGPRGGKIEVFFTTPDGDEVPAGTWCFLAIDPERTALRAYPVEAFGEAGVGMEARLIALEDEAELEWLRVADEAGCARATQELGERYMRGYDGLDKDRDKALALLRRAAESGLAPAQYEYAEALDRTAEFGTPEYEQIRRKRLKWIRKAAEGGYWRAESELGRRYLTREPDLAKAEKWYRLAEAHHPYPGAALYSFAWQLEAAQEAGLVAGGDPIALYRESAREGYRKAQKRLREKGLSW